MSTNDLRFDVNSLTPLITSSAWILKNATVSSSAVIINTQGSARCELTDSVLNKVFQYFRVEIEYTSDVVTSISNFKNTPYALITETYKNENNEVYKNRTRALGFNTFDPIPDKENTFRDVTIFSSLNKRLAYYSFEIINNTSAPLIISKVGVFSSIDISEEQVGGVINTVNAETEPEGFKVYTDPEYKTLNGLAVTLKNSDKELKYKPIYAQGLLSSIETNFGITYPVVYVTDNIDLTT